MAEVKFCGLTRVEDARVAGEIGASYVGVIFAGGPRLLTEDKARDVLDACKTGAARVGVVGPASAENLATLAERVRLDVLQLHFDPTPEFVDALRGVTRARMWAVIRSHGNLPDDARELFAVADAVVLDASGEGGRGGSGVALPWDRLAEPVARARGRGQLVLAGGLTPGNVARAASTLGPDIVDVSSGVESAPGIKDHARMRAFAAAAATSR